MKFGKIKLGLASISLMLLFSSASSVAQTTKSSASAQTSLPYPTAIQACYRSPVLFGYRGLRGRAVPIRRTIARLGEYADFTNKAGSLCVPRGWGVQLYKNRNFGPPSMNVVGQQAISFTADGWNNEVTSVRVFRYNDRGGYWEEQY